MKKTIVLFSAYLLIATTGIAQKLSFGVKGAVTTSFLTFRIDNDDDNRLIGNNVGFYAGGIANFQVSEKFSIQPNLLFAMKGSAIQGYNVTTFHVDLPINFLYNNNGFFMGGGPNISYALSGKVKVGSEHIDIFDQDEASEYTLKRFELGANFLLGYNFPGGISLSASFTPGLLDIYKGAEDSEGNVKAHLKTFGLSVGYMFGKGK